MVNSLDKETLSVIVPVYNVEGYLEQCLESILAQTYSNLEIILVDDGSTDGSGAICDAYHRKDNRIRVIHKENGGLISARMTGVMAAGTEFITFVDSDDWIDTGMYQALMPKMIDYNVDLVISGCIRYFHEEMKIKSYDKKIECGLYQEEDIRTKIIPIMLWQQELNGWALDPSLCTKIFRKELLLKQYCRIKGETFYYGEDTAVIYPYMLEVKKIYCIWGGYYYHRQRSQGIVAGYIMEDTFFSNLLSLYKYLHGIFSKSEYRETLIMQLDLFYIKGVQLRSLKYEKNVIGLRCFLFPFHKVLQGSNIVLYGAGNVGKQFFSQINKTNYCNIIAWVDKRQGMTEGQEIRSISVITEKAFDFIVVAILDEDTRHEVKKELFKYGMTSERIIDEVQIL